jgi:hypothetical protein
MSNSNDDTTTTDITTIKSDGVYDMIPSIEQLQNDPFMKQVRYAEFIISLFEEDNGRETLVLMNRLRAQLSHPDGIRGFMVTYLTTTTTPTTDHNTDIPQSLIKVIVEQIDPVQDRNELISLMCMNVIMPTGMITMQPTKEMSHESEQTAKRAIQLLKTVLSNCNSNHNNNNAIHQAITKQCNAILSVATTTGTDDETSSNYKVNDMDDDDKGQVLYWSQFFKKWGYQSKQQSDIANAIRSILQQ